MKIHADPTTDGTGIALDVDHPNTLQTFGPDFIPRAVVLTPAEAADLRDELTQALDKIAPKTRTPADVPTDPQPGAVWTEYAAWPDGFITDIDDTGRATLDASENRDSIVRVWAFEPPRSYQHARELATASDVPPPTT
jgi:hypothetical protein